MPAAKHVGLDELLQATDLHLEQIHGLEIASIHSHSSRSAPVFRMKNAMITLRIYL